MGLCTFRTSLYQKLPILFQALDVPACSYSYHHGVTKEKTGVKLTSKQIRKLFIDYFVQKKQHTYIPSSPVFLDNDPSLFFVNAGMNQFKPRLLNKLSPSHDFYNLRKAANSQKCVRISGKHNDLDDVGLDFHHHTFFEMLGNWSFGDYFKKDACTMAWEVLTKMYGLPEEKLFVTYFSGDESLGLPPDLETRDIWQEIGLPSDHILPFGVKENFWDMGDTGPCGPCTEIHYSYLNSGQGSHEASLVNTGRPELIEVWNLVFMEYNREKNGTLNKLPTHNVDTGMGLERLTSILQGTTSNYDTDIFVPIFKAMQKNFNVKSYEGSQSEMDVAYRIIADHARMFTIAISDGLLPESFGAGHILRKIIRRSAFMANKVMKTRPGVLSAVVPYVAETLDFFPEIANNVDDVISIVNEEEKQFHQIINRGRKIRNKMMVEAANEKILSGKNVWDLCNNFGLEENVVEDLAAEVDFRLDWNGYHKICEDQDKLKSTSLKHPSDMNLPPNAIQYLLEDRVSHTDDSYKYGVTNTKPGGELLSANILAIIADEGKLLSSDINTKCCIVTDRTNFYSNAGGQVSDRGTITTESTVFDVENVHASSGYIFHEGILRNGQLKLNETVQLCVNKVHRQKCSNNHTATHLLNASLRKLFPQTSQRSSHVDANHLRLGFSCKMPLTLEHVIELENFVNQAVEAKHSIKSIHMKLEDVQGMPNVVFLRGEVYPENITLVQVVDEDCGKDISVEPCCGTHVNNTSHIGKFVITDSKSQSGSVKVLTAVTGETAEKIIGKGDVMMQRLKTIQLQVEGLKTQIPEKVEFKQLLKDVKKLLHECNLANDIPLRVRQTCESTLIALKLMLTNLISPVQDKENQSKSENDNEILEKDHIPKEVHSFMMKSCFPSTNDSYKYNYCIKDGVRVVSPLSTQIQAVFHNNCSVQSIVRGQHCFIVTDCTNFYSKGDGQESDNGQIYNNEFQMNVTRTYGKNGYVYHEGWIKEGTLETGTSVTMEVDQNHRHSCSLHHTSCHLLHTALLNVSPYAFIQSSFASGNCLRVQFKLQKALPLTELQKIEDAINATIAGSLKISRTTVPQTNLKEVPNLFLPPGEVFPDPVPIISIGDKQSGLLVSMEPCCGTHAENTSELSRFIIVTSKAGKNMEKIIRAVSGSAAKEVLENGSVYEKNILELQEKVIRNLNNTPRDFLELWDLLREVKASKNYHEMELPLLSFRKHQDTLTSLSISLTNATNTFVQQSFDQLQSEMKDVLRNNTDSKYIIHKINAYGDGKKLTNVALAAVPDRPAFFFAQDGRNTMICSCSVPKSHVSSSLTALLWLEPVAALLKGRARFQTKDPDTYYSVEFNDEHNIEEAMLLAKKYIESCL